MSAMTNLLLEKLNELIFTASEMRQRGHVDLALAAEEQITAVRKQLNEANVLLDGKDLLKG